MAVKLHKKIASIKQEVQNRADYDKKNIADEIRGSKANSVVHRLERNFSKVLGSENNLLETDANQPSSLVVDGLTFLSKAKNSFANLLTLSIIKDATVSAATDEEQTIEFDAVPDAGAWSIAFGNESTASLAFDDEAAAVQAALRAISGLEAVTVSGDYSLGFTVVFAGVSGDLALLTEDSNTLESLSVAVAITIAESVAGVASVDETGVTISGNHMDIRCESAATNTEVKAIVDASSKALSLMSVSIEAGEGATAASATVAGQFKGDA